MNHPISVWDFDDAPKELQLLSDNGGDEDWLAEIPPQFDDRWIGWIESQSFGCANIQTVDHPSKPGWKIKIGSHA